MPTETRKFIIGWLTFPPDRRAEFLALARPYIATCRAEPGCLFFEMNPSLTDPDTVVISECFASKAAHEAHLATQNFRDFWAALNSLALTGRFENIYASEVILDSATFGTPSVPQAKA